MNLISLGIIFLGSYFSINFLWSFKFSSGNMKVFTPALIPPKILSSKPPIAVTHP